ncbi:replicative DNA helicase [Desulfocucumis palustris]|uniref:Replicative DNA helicase n=1 Tax=Desulfocucumis palustris TaxID=1898651 RepID=A0A2L2X8I2_9FIRM|nr:replicative DNA helicase [Desulfocucumis palustris]GBF32485.1 replicative DNA helicase [Desulfocucumis palustris]
MTVELPGRIPPQNIDAEQSVLGAMFLDREAIYKVIRHIKAEDFYLESHRLIFEAIIKMDEAGKAPDLVTVTDHLKQHNQLEKIGGVTYVASLIGMVPTAANVEHYARIVEEKSILRSLIAAATRIAGMGYEGGEEADKLVTEAEQMLMELSSRRNAAVFKPLSEILLEIFNIIENRYRNKGQITGVQTGFTDMDRLCCGLQPGDLIIMAGRPAMGKTSLGMTIAHNVALHSNMPVAVFSLEMSRAQLVQRILCAEAMVDQQKVRSGYLDEADWSSLVKAAGKLSKAHLYIDDSAGLTVRQLRAKARNLKAEKGLGLVVIDYLQLLSGSSRENRQQEISEISRSLKGLAKDLEVPVIALAQLSRAVEQRQDKKPIMSDLRESGSLEQDADVVMFIYREEYYKPETEKKGIAEIIVAKQRNGPTGVVELAFIKEFTRFVNLSRDYEAGAQNTA